MKKTTLSDLEASFDVIEAICVVAELNTADVRTEVDVTLLVEGPNSGRVKVSSKALARIVELAREALDGDGVMARQTRMMKQLSHPSSADAERRW